MKWSSIVPLFIALVVFGDKGASVVRTALHEKFNNMFVLNLSLRSKFRSIVRLRGGFRSERSIRTLPKEQNAFTGSVRNSEDISGDKFDDIEDNGDSSAHSDSRDHAASKRRKSTNDKSFDKKLHAYSQKYGLSIGQPANPLPILLEKAAKAIDAKTRLKIKKERFEEQRKEIDKIKKQLKEDSAKRPCRCC